MLTRIEQTLLSEAKDAKSLAKRLIDVGVLTAFQCKFILRGKAKILRIGGYVVQDSIGAGGMGEVYKATHRKLKRDAAIKILPSRVVKDQQAVQRFEREAEAAAQLPPSCRTPILSPLTTPTKPVASTISSWNTWRAWI